MSRWRHGAARGRGRGQHASASTGPGLEGLQGEVDDRGDQVVERPVKAGQRRGQQRRDLVVVGPQQRHVAWNVQPERPSGGVHAVGHRVGQAEECRRRRAAAQDLQGDSLCSLELVRGGVQGEVQAELVGDPAGHHLGRPVGRVRLVRGQDGDVSMACVGQGLQGSACCGGVVEDHARSGPGAGDGVADRDQDRPLGDRGPVVRGRVDGQHDDGVDPLVDQLGSQRLLEQRVVGGVDDQGLPPLLHQCATERGGDSLLPQVGQGAAHHADVTGASRDEGAGDGVDLVAEPIRGLAYALLGLLGHLQTPQGVGDGSHRQADLVGHMLEGDPLGAFAHRADPSRGGHAASPIADKTTRVNRFSDTLQ